MLWEHPPRQLNAEDQTVDSNLNIVARSAVRQGEGDARRSEQFRCRKNVAHITQPGPNSVAKTRQRQVGGFGVPARQSGVRRGRAPHSGHL